MAKLMLVEDDNNLREIYEARLQAEGYDIVSAKDGEEALVVAKAEQPDLIISDVMMPKISGFEMLDILRNTDGLKEVKVIMLTALGQSDDQERADKLGADRYLVKSQVTLEDIVKTAHDLLEGESAPTETTTEETVAPAEPTPTAVVEPPADSKPETVVHDTPVVPAPAPVTEPVPPQPEAVAAPEPPAPAPAPQAPVAVEVEEPAVAAPAPEPAATEAPAPEAPTPKPEVVTPEPQAPVTAEETATAPIIEPSATAPEPVATTEAPTTDVSSEPEPVADPSPEPEIAAPEPEAPKEDEESKKIAPSTATEEADVEAKIEDFVAGATTEPSTPVETETPSLPATPPAETTETSASVEQTNTECNDKLTTEAVDALMSNTEENADTPTQAPKIVIEPVMAPGGEEAPAGAPATPPSEASTPEQEPEVQSGSTGGTRVITPIDTEPKKDISELLAEEEAKDIVSEPVPEPAAIVNSDANPTPAAPGSVTAPPETKTEATQAPATAKPTQPNPNDIAL